MAVAKIKTSFGLIRQSCSNAHYAKILVVSEGWTSLAALICASSFCSEGKGRRVESDERKVKIEFGNLKQSILAFKSATPDDLESCT